MACLAVRYDSTGMSAAPAQVKGPRIGDLRTLKHLGVL